MALKYHPDRNPGDQEAEDLFKEAAEAYEVLQMRRSDASMTSMAMKGCRERALEASTV